MTVFSNFFSDAVVQGQQFKGQNISLESGVTKFNWPIPGIAEPVLSQIMNITEVTSSATIELPPANAVEAFKSILFVNKSEGVFSVHSYNGDPLDKGRLIKNINPGEAFFIYLEDNKTFPGRWFDVAFGASGVLFEPSQIAGAGIASTVDTIYRIISGKDVSAPTSGAIYNITNADNTKLLINTISTASNYLLPAISSVDAGFFIYIYNASEQPITLLTTGNSVTVDGSFTHKILNQSMSCCILLDSSDSSNWIATLSNIPIPLLSNPILFPSTQFFATSGQYTEDQWKALNAQTIVCNTTSTTTGAAIAYDTLNLKLPNPANMPPYDGAIAGNGFNFFLVNKGSGNLLLTCETALINNLSATYENPSNPGWMTFGPGTSCQVISDGVNWWTMYQGASNGVIQFISTYTSEDNSLNIQPQHWGTTFLCTASNTQYILLDYNNSQLWMGFRININAGSTTVIVRCANGGIINNVENASVTIYSNVHYSYDSGKYEFWNNYPGGAVSFIYGGDNNWYQI